MPDNQLEFHSAYGKRRILIVEDELINQEMLKIVLDDVYDTISAETGAEALARLAEGSETISLVLLDLNLPDMHGLDVLKQMKADSRSARIPVIVMTAEKDAEVESLTLGAIDFIPKPYPQPKVIHARVLRTIELCEDRDIIRSTERDHLTGLYNREYFYRYAAQYDVYHKEQPTDAIVLDINHFHIINERYGKGYGDEVLKRIGEKVLDAVRASGGIVCRREADTFLAYCPHRSDYAEILENASVTLRGDGRNENRVRLRMGVYASVDKSIDIERRFDRAKLAADTVKNSFTKAIGIYDDSLHESEIFAEQLLDGFETAVREKQFEVVYQPKFNIRPQVPVLTSAEVLVRWKHPQLGTVSPAVFIPLFEQNGLIRQLDDYIWREAAARMKDWKDRGVDLVPVSVNVSRIDLYDPFFVERMQEIMESNGLSPAEFYLEVTESAYTENSDQIIRTVKQLREKGFRIEMDDFGSGYSSLNMISTLPIDALKLDMEFIRNAFRERKDTRLLEVVIQLAESLEVPTIAEGVETAEQMLTLKTMGCDIVQGYYFSRPLSAKEFEIFMKERKGREPEEQKKTGGKGQRQLRDKFT
ncbi:MAG: EAL domain-containing protein [Stomatobaculum sp.]|nr:EAL domain-containing protein [Stomatobaculum sp.]